MGRGLGVIGFPGVTAYTDRHGKKRFRYRRRGQPQVALPGLPGSPEFAAAYATAADRPAPGAGAKRTKANTLNALAVMTYGTAEWKQLKPQTQITYRGIIERMRANGGDMPLTMLDSAMVKKMRDGKADTPSAANNMVKVLRWMCALAVERNLMTVNPCLGIKPLKVRSGGFHTWTDEEIARFEARWAVGTPERLAMALALYTLQRRGDVYLLGRQNIRDGRIGLTQGKTGAELEVPIHPKLAECLAKVPPTQMLLLQSNKGAPYTRASFGNWFRKACREAGLVGCSMHGLRKAQCRRLAEAGASAKQIMALSGHKTLKEVARYTEAAEQKRMAQDAMALVGGTEPGQDLANPEKLAWRT